MQVGLRCSTNPLLVSCLARLPNQKQFYLLCVAVKTSVSTLGQDGRQLTNLKYNILKYNNT
jgi:hypothetical protein